MVFVGGDDGVSVCRAAFAIPQQDAVLLGAHDVTQFTQFRNEGGDTVGLLYFKALQSGEAERDVHQAAGDDKGLRQVRDVHHVFVETGGGSTLPGQFYSPVCIFGMDAEAGKDFRAAAVALIAVGEETEQFDFCRVRFFLRAVFTFFCATSVSPFYFFIFNSFYCHHLIPVRGGAPIAFYGERGIRVSAGADGDAIFGDPVGLGAEVAHQLQGQVDVGAGDDVTRQVQAQAFGKDGTNHQQGGYVL